MKYGVDGEYYNHSYGIECSYDCFHIPKHDHYHKIEELAVPIAKSVEDRGERTFFHEYEHVDHFRLKSADGRPRAYNRLPFDGPYQQPPFVDQRFGNEPVQHSKNQLQRPRRSRRRV